MLHLISYIDFVGFKSVTVFGFRVGDDGLKLRLSTSGQSRTPISKDVTFRHQKIVHKFQVANITMSPTSFCPGFRVDQNSQINFKIKYLWFFGYCCLWIDFTTYLWCPQRRYSCVFTTVFTFTAQVVFGLYEFISFLFCQTLTCC